MGREPFAVALQRLRRRPGAGADARESL